jgi:hypothetical protein
MENLRILRKFIREEIGRNYHTIDDTPYTFDDFQDYDIQVDGSTAGGFYLTVYYKDEKIFPSQMFSSHDDAQHHSRMVVDRDRVRRMNE